MNLNSLSETITKYEQITGETFLQPADCAIKIIDNEFMIWRLGTRDGVSFFYIDQTFAKSFSIFVPFIKEVCQVAEITTIVTATTRRPNAHIKKWKMFHLPELDYEYEGRHYHVLKGDIQNIK